MTEIPAGNRISDMKDGRGFGKRMKSGLRRAEEARASSIAASISIKVENSYPEAEIAQAEKKAWKKYRYRKVIRNIWDRIKLLFFIAGNPSLWGRAFAVPAAVGVLYLVLPLDAVPDMIPYWGLLDDVFVISGMIELIVKSASPLTKGKLLSIRKECPDDMRAPFDSMFSIDASSLENDEEHATLENDEKEVKIENAAHDIGIKLRKAGDFISSFHAALDSVAVDNPSIRRKWLYRAVNRIDQAVAEPDKAAVFVLEKVLKLMLLKKSVRSLISFSAFALSLYFFSMKDLGPGFLVLSSLSMLLSYAFFIRSIIKNVPKIYHFLLAWFNDGLEAGVVALLFKDTASNPGLKEALVTCGVRKIRNDRDIQQVLLKNFGKTVIAFIIRIGLITVSVYALKKVVLLTSGLTSSFQILFAPVVELIALLS